jgi:hypothetical protein
MNLFEKIIEALDIKLGRAYLLEALLPFSFKGAINERNVLVQLNNGEMTNHLGGKLKPGSFYFIPQGHSVKLRVGKGANVTELNEEDLYNERFALNTYKISVA